MTWLAILQLLTALASLFCAWLIRYDPLAPMESWLAHVVAAGVLMGTAALILTGQLT